MSEISQVVESIEFKLQKVHTRLDFLKSENERLLGEIDQITLEKEELLSKFKLQSEELDTLKIAKSMLGSNDYKRETKLKINNIIKEIDYCIKQLSV
ncbi:MAG: hypothetical protein HRT68_05255 [Flavobacteriaceae bacterium]|nr:hypothetical protein [Flavobacteriaceae bacterium]